MGREALKKECCGTTVWDVPNERSLPRVTEIVLCRVCGKDYSRQPGFLVRLAYIWKRLQKRRRSLGLIGLRLRWHYMGKRAFWDKAPERGMTWLWMWRGMPWRECWNMGRPIVKREVVEGPWGDAESVASQIS